jgi:hypothetical protein
VVNRSNNNANANGGVADVSSGYALSSPNANIGSRLAHRMNFKRVVSDTTIKADGGYGYMFT